MKSLTPEQLESLLKNIEPPVQNVELSSDDKRELQFFQMIDVALRQDLSRNTSDSFTSHVMGAIDALKPSLIERCLMFLRKNVIVALIGGFMVFVALLLYFTPEPSEQAQLYPQSWYMTHKLIFSTSQSLEFFSRQSMTQAEGLLRLILPFKETSNLFFILIALALLYSFDRGLRLQRQK